MNLPVMPPISPMLARLARSLPEDEHLVYEPKWDGFRCIAFRDRRDVYLQSRSGKPLARYFPELTAALGRARTPRLVADGEIVVPRGAGLDFEALLNRLHPARSRVASLSAATPSFFIAFDLLALDGENLLARPFVERRQALERALGTEGRPISVTPFTHEVPLARNWFGRFCGAGLDGVMVKHIFSPYQPGRRTLVKVKHDYTADCVVAGFRWHYAEPAVGSLLLGVYEDGTLHHIGLASSFRREQRIELLAALEPFVTMIEDHPWSTGFGHGPPGAVARLPGTASHWGDDAPNWVPLRPELVAEVAYDHLDGRRFRHGARFRRWRPDRDPTSCTYDQFDVTTAAFGDVIADLT